MGNHNPSEGRCGVTAMGDSDSTAVSLMLGESRTCQEPCAGTGLHPRVLWAAGGAGGLCRTVPAPLGLPRAHKCHCWEQPGLSISTSTSQELDPSTSPGPQHSQPPLCSPPSSKYQQQWAPSNLSVLSQVVPHRPQLQPPILRLILSAQPPAPGALCLGAEQFPASHYKIPCANANGVNLPPHKHKDARDGAEEPAKLQPHGHEW